jgi:hypothetical protein
VDGKSKTSPYELILPEGPLTKINPL